MPNLSNRGDQKGTICIRAKCLACTSGEFKPSELKDQPSWSQTQGTLQTPHLTELKGQPSWSTTHGTQQGIQTNRIERTVFERDTLRNSTNRIASERSVVTDPRDTLGIPQTELQGQTCGHLTKGTLQSRGRITALSASAWPCQGNP